MSPHGLGAGARRVCPQTLVSSGCLRALHLLLYFIQPFRCGLRVYTLFVAVVLGTFIVTVVRTNVTLILSFFLPSPPFAPYAVGVQSTWLGQEPTAAFLHLEFCFGH